LKSAVAQVAGTTLGVSDRISSLVLPELGISPIPVGCRVSHDKQSEDEAFLHLFFQGDSESIHFFFQKPNLVLSRVYEIHEITFSAKDEVDFDQKDIEKLKNLFSQPMLVITDCLYESVSVNKPISESCFVLNN
jgi:hypothetical protein